MGSSGGPLSFIAVLLSHISSGIVGFWVGNRSGFEQAPERHLGHLADTAAELAVERCQEWVEKRFEFGGDWPEGPASDSSVGKPKPSKIVAGGSSTPWWTWAVLALGWILAIIALVFLWLLRKSRVAPISSPSSPTSDLSRRGLAHQQLAEVRLRKHVAGK